MTDLVAQFAQCAGKERFDTMELASRVAKLSMRRNEGKQRQPYRCRHCGGFHVGSARPKQVIDYRRERERQRTYDLEADPA